AEEDGRRSTAMKSCACSTRTSCPPSSSSSSMATSSRARYKDDNLFEDRVEDMQHVWKGFNWHLMQACRYVEDVVDPMLHRSRRRPIKKKMPRAQAHHATYASSDDGSISSSTIFNPPLCLHTPQRQNVAARPIASSVDCDYITSSRDDRLVDIRAAIAYCKESQLSTTN
ncbi:hypothetical protein GOP47_0026897, partial [Adiantum capillus-veneris]